MLSIFLAIAVAQGTAPTKAETKELDPAIRPVLELAKFKNMKGISVSEYRSTNPENKALIVTRVYRFTYKADYNKEAKAWSTTFPKKDGWKVENVVAKGLILGRKVNHARITSQALILHVGRIVFDKSSRANTKTIEDKNWVWVSFNETLKGK